MNISKINHQIIVFPIFLLIMVFILWASLMKIGEFVRGVGKIVPSGQIKRVQHLEGGIISNIAVKEGQQVAKGQVLYVIKNEFALSSLNELQINLNSKLAAEARLNAELSGAENVQFPKEIAEKYPSIVDNERKVFLQRKESFEQSLNVLKQQSDQRRSQLQEETNKIKNLTIQYQYAKDQEQIVSRLLKAGAASQKEAIDSKLRAQGLLTELEEYKNKIQTTEQSIQEALARQAEATSKRNADLQSELSVVLVEIEKLKDNIAANMDRVSRNEIVSPVDGVVKALSYNTLGGIIRAGDVVAEIIPSDEKLIIEARISPQDRARVYPGQSVNIAVSAYSSRDSNARLRGVVTEVSADTFLDEGTRAPYYSLKIETDFANRGYNANKPVYPGMNVEVNIEAGTRTVMAYILNPVLRVFASSFSEP